MTARPFILGLTGSIATGKSTALAVFEKAGIPVFSADAAVHVLYDGGAAVRPIAALVPEAVHDNRVDRAVLSRVLQAEPQKFRQLEQIVHPLVRQARAGFIAEAAQRGAPFVVIDVPLLFESGGETDIDAVAVTFCDEDEQRRRALARPGMTTDKLDTILSRQMPQAEKIARADFLIDTNQSLEDTRRAVDKIIATLKAGWTRPPRPVKTDP